jgi:hypothetical protein
MANCRANTLGCTFTSTHSGDLECHESTCAFNKILPLFLSQEKKISDYTDLISSQQQQIEYLNEKLALEKQKFQNYLQQEQLKQNFENLKLQRDSMQLIPKYPKAQNLKIEDDGIPLQFVSVESHPDLKVMANMISNDKTDGEYKISFMNKKLDRDLTWNLTVYGPAEMTWIGVGCGELKHNKDKNFVFVSHQEKLWMISFYCYSGSANNYSWNDGQAHALAWNTHAFDPIGETVTVVYKHDERTIRFDTSQGSETIVVNGECYPMVILGRNGDRVQLNY